MLQSNDSYFDEEELWDEDTDSIENSFIIITLNKFLYAIRLDKVQEIIKLPDLQTFPEMQEFDRGFIKLREDVIRIIDLRKKLKYRTLEDEENQFMENIHLAKQAHIEWIEELQKCVYENTTFCLATDAKKCKFGIWYDNFKTENSAISFLMQQFDVPHQKLHRISGKVLSLKENGRVKESLEIIENIKNTELKYLLDLFNNVHSQLITARREIAVIFQFRDKLLGCTADSVLNIIDILPEQIESPDRIDTKDYISGIAKTKEGVILILDENKLI